jgi:hypothetical protein
MALSSTRSNNERQFAASLGQMPPDGDGADTKERRDRRDGQPFEFVHDEDSAATWLQPVERTPDRRSRDEGGFLIGAHGRGMPRFFLVSSSNSRLSPLVAPKVDENADQPRFLTCRTEWNGRDRARGPQKCVLDEIRCRIGSWNKAPRQAVQPLVVGVEKPGQSVGRGLLERDWQNVGDWQPIHILVNVPGLNYVGACERMTPLSQVEG